MTHNTDAERAEFEAWVKETQKLDDGWWCRQLLDGGYSAGNVDAAWKAWQAARRAPAAPVHTTSEHSKPMFGAAPKVDPIAWYVTGCSTMLDEHEAKAEAKRCGGTAQAVPLYTEPQPPEAKASVSNGTFAAPVQLPEPVAWRDPKNFLPSQGCTYEKSTAKKWAHIYTEPLYTEQQVRDLLAANGIGKDKA